MNLQQIKDTDAALHCIESRLAPLLDQPFRDALTRVSALMAEVRHFAVMWADVADVEPKSKYHAAQLREEAITRLVQTISPD